MTPPRSRQPVSDARAAAAIEEARAEAERLGGPAGVGEHRRAVGESDRVVTHTFACTLPGYRGWEWSVTVVRASRAREVTISEAVLLPGADAILAPEWVPYSERIQAGDLGVGELLPTEPDDPRLEPGYTQVTEEPDTDPVGLVAIELGLGRPRVLSPEGRDDAVTRWYTGAHGPESPVAQAAPAPCSTCGYLVLLGGPMRAMFGVCANEWSPSDGQVVSYDHGCGAHSETVVEHPDRVTVEPVVDTLHFDPLAISSSTADPV